MAFFIKTEYKYAGMYNSRRERLAVTLRYLATGRNFEDLKFSAIMSPSAMRQAISETCHALVYVL